jgi:TetR/AcrR family transcriptional regulator, transcriptional repressor for nem operon
MGQPKRASCSRRDISVRTSALSRPAGSGCRSNSVLYEQGIEKSTLADIAVAAEVPLGNVYYYFKTKDALVSAVIESYQRTGSSRHITT